MLRRLAPLVLVASLVPGTARGEEPEGLRLRMFPVTDLVNGTTQFIPESMGVPSQKSAPDDVLLLGSEGEEPVLPYGTADELIEQLKNRVEPESWSRTEGAEILAHGESLVVRAVPRVLDAIATYLGDLEATYLTAVTVEVRTSSAPVPADATPDDLAASSVGPAVTLTALAGQRACALSGRQKAFVQGHTAIVASGSQTLDPLVAVANLGIGVRCMAVPSGADRVVLDLSVAVAELSELREVAFGERRNIDVPTWRTLRARSFSNVKPGVWTLVQGAPGDTGVVVVRVAIARPPPVPSRASLDAGPWTPAGRGPVVDSPLDVGDLMTAPPSRIGELVYLAPSNWKPPEPPELCEPMPLSPIEGLAELVKSALGPGAWDAPDSSIEPRNGVLHVRARRDVVARAADLVSQLRASAVRTLDVDAEAVDLPDALARRVAGSGSAGFLLDDAERAAIEQAKVAGQARTVAVLRTSGFDGRTNAAMAGTRIEYVQGHDSRIADRASVATSIVHSVLSGTVVQVRPSLASGGHAASVEVQFTRSHVRQPIRRVATPSGDIETPEMDLTRFRCTVPVPLDRTAVVGAGSDGQRAVVLLLTPRIRPD